MWVQSLGWKDPLEEVMATSSSILAWEIPWTERNLAGCTTRGRKELDTTEHKHTQFPVVEELCRDISSLMHFKYTVLFKHYGTMILLSTLFLQKRISFSY